MRAKIGIKQSFVLTEQQRKMLDADAARMKVPMAEALRRALDEWRAVREAAAGDADELAA